VVFPELECILASLEAELDELLIRGGSVALPDGMVGVDLLIKDGRIAAIAENLPVTTDNTLQLHGEAVLPGGIDVHVHLPWPTGGFISSDDFDTGTRAAAFGGVTTLIDFVIPETGESLAEAVDKKRKLADAKTWVDYGLHINLRGNLMDRLLEIPKLVKAGYPSYKIFLAYDGFRVKDTDLPGVFMQVGAAGGMLTVHAEDGLLADRLSAGLMAQGKTALRFYPEARPAACEIRAVEKILTLQEQYGTPVHIHHVSTRQVAELIGVARKQGRRISAETCPHYLLFDQAVYFGDLQLAAQLVCSPSIKTAADRAGLWEALDKDWVNMIATDHCPYRLVQKENDLTDFTQTPGGLGGVELRLPLIYSEGVVKRRLSMQQFVDVWATNPARSFGLFPRKGIIAIGSDADLVILDTKRSVTIHADNLKMNTDCTPYEDWQVTGWPVGTILRGKPVMQEGKLIGQNPGGEFIARHLKQSKKKHGN
jgi:dihydropyrimidinase